MHLPHTLLLRLLKAQDPPCPVSFFSLMSTAVSLPTLGCQSPSLQLSPQAPLSREFTSILWLPKPWNLRDNSLFGGHLSSPHSRPMRRAHKWIHDPRGLCWGHVAQWAAPSVFTCMRRPVPCGVVRAVRVTPVACALPQPLLPRLSQGFLLATSRKILRPQAGGLTEPSSCRSEPGGPGRPVPSGCTLPAGVGPHALPGEFPQALDKAASPDICRMNG